MVPYPHPLFGAVPTDTTWVRVSTFHLSMIPQPNHTCSAMGYGLRTIIRCVDNSVPYSRWAGYSIYKFFQRTDQGGKARCVAVGPTQRRASHACQLQRSRIDLSFPRQGRVLIGYTFSGVGVALVFMDRPVQVVATMPWGAEWTTDLQVSGVRRPSAVKAVKAIVA